MSMDVKLGDTVYWYWQCYPYVIQSGKVVGVERMERIVRKHVEIEVTGVLVKEGNGKPYRLDKSAFYLDRLTAATHCLQDERFKLAMEHDSMGKIQDAINCMEQIIREESEVNHE